MNCDLKTAENYWILINGGRKEKMTAFFGYGPLEENSFEESDVLEDLRRSSSITK